MVYDYEYQSIASNSDDLYDSYNESFVDSDDQVVSDYDHYYFNLAKEIVDEDI